MNKRKVIYKRLVVEGFQSIAKPTVFNLDRGAGINLIKGANGKGKSTIFNALFWGEYGINLKKSVATWVDKRPTGYRGTRVVVERTDGEFDYMIARHFEFKGTTRGLQGGDKLMIFKKPVDQAEFSDKDLVGAGQHKDDMNLLIEQQIGVDSTTYLNSILFGQRMKSLAETDAKDKRTLFDKLFDVAFVDAAKEKGTAERTRLTTLITGLASNISTAQQIVDTNTKILDEQAEIKKKFDLEQSEKISDLEVELDEAKQRSEHIPAEKALLQKKIDAYDWNSLIQAKDKADKSKEHSTTQQDKAKKLKQAVDNANNAVEDSNKKQVKLQKDLEEIIDTCTVCGQPLDKKQVAEAKKRIKQFISTEETVAKALKAALEKATKEHDTFLPEVQKAKDQYNADLLHVSTVEESLKGADALKKELNTLDNEETQLKKDVVRLEASIKKEKEAKPPVVDIAAYTKSKEDSLKIVEAKTKEKEEAALRLSKVDWWCTKGFGASGLKAFVFNAMLSGLNQAAHRYAARLGFRVEFGIDMSKASKPFRMLIYSGGNVRDYGDLSGGQKQRVDMVIAFAMHDLVSFKTDINILLMDEITEGLDNAGVEAAFQLIREKAKDKTVYVITHLDMLDGLGAKYIFVDSDENDNTIIE